MLELQGKDDFIITLSSGYRVQALGMPQTVIDKIRGTKKYPPVPTYSAPTAFDPDARLPHQHEWVELDEFDPKAEVRKPIKKLVSTLQTDEDHKAWDEYQAACRAEDARVAAQITKAVLLCGIKVLDDPAADWEQVQTYLGIDVPQDPMEKRIHWLSTEVMHNGMDLTDIFKENMRKTGMTKEQIESVVGSFRPNVERDTTTAGIESAARQVDNG